MQSMTGFGQGAAENTARRVTATLRGVNHRYLDVSLRLQGEMRSLERALRDRVKARLERGRVEVTFEVEALGGARSEVEIDDLLVIEVRGEVERLETRGLLAGGVTFADLLRVPDAVRFTARGAAWGEADEVLVFEALDRALDQLTLGRATEGAALRAVLAERLDELESRLEQMVDRAPTAAEEAARALRERVERLLDGAAVDPARLAQEAAVLAERADVREELDRLGSHLEHFRGLLGTEGAIGKRLDFLSQEIHRELNTIASKCKDAALTRDVLDGKVLCEQLREQVQNVE